MDLESYYKISPFFFIIAAASSILFAISFTLSWIGADLESMPGLEDVPTSSDVSFKIISSQAFLSFFMGLGWAGYTAIYSWKMNFSLAFAFAVVIGLGLMLFTSYLWFQIKKLNHVVLRKSPVS